MIGMDVRYMQRQRREERVQVAIIERSMELSDEVLEEIKEGQQAAIEAVRKFADTVDKTLAGDDHPSGRQEIVDSALKMADRLVATQYDFLRKVVHTAGESLGASSDEE
jgi:hypothetical protein